MNTATEVVAPRMQGLHKLEKTLKRLDLSWKLIETTARVVSPPQLAGYIETLERTRVSFNRLAGEMVEQIARSHLDNCTHDLAARAQVAIDILVRNLFERTADVGFIATDAPLVQFALAPQDSARPVLRARLDAYRAKYSVYDDILVLDSAAQVLLSLQARESAHTAVPAWWQQALATHSYGEHYGPSELFPGLGPVLLYAHRIVSADGRVCGAVVLKFDLRSELDSIFRALGRAGTVLLLLDAEARVVASNAPARFAPCQQLRPGTLQHGQALRHQGVDYLVAHCQTRGYQGYGGPGWTAAALVDLEQAFADLPEGAAGAGAADLALDNPQLQHTVARARAIEEDLNRVIWNGKLSESVAMAGSALRPVFAEIGRTSQQTIAVFDDAIRALKALLLLGRRAELSAHAALAVDIMDRNLYERANDCRWWALSEELADLLQTLEAAPADGTAQQRAAAILAHLNSLYTVYRRVALFDRQGRILAVSKDAETLPQELQLPPALLQRTLALQGSQAYAVSAMEPHALADGAHTYLYCAPIRRAGSGQALGGMALAFNCQAELQAMLTDALPQGAAALGFFVDPAGRVLSGTDAGVAVGSQPAFAVELLAQGQRGGPQLCEWQGQTWLAALAPSQGYREFKVSDGYREDVHALLLTPVQRSPAASLPRRLPRRSAESPGAACHYGVVQCGRLLFGLGSADVIEAVAALRLAGAPVASDAAGLLEYSNGGVPTVVPVYDACLLTGQPAIAEPLAAVAVVVRRGTQTLALLVDRLVDVIACDPAEPPPGGINPAAPWISGYLHDGQADAEPVFTLDPGAFEVAGMVVAQRPD